MKSELPEKSGGVFFKGIECELTTSGEVLTALQSRREPLDFEEAKKCISVLVAMISEDAKSKNEMRSSLKAAIADIERISSELASRKQESRKLKQQISGLKLNARRRAQAKVKDSATINSSFVQKGSLVFK